METAVAAAREERAGTAETAQMMLVTVVTVEMGVQGALVETVEVEPEARATASIKPGTQPRSLTSPRFNSRLVMEALEASAKEIMEAKGVAEPFSSHVLRRTGARRQALIHS